VLGDPAEEVLKSHAFAYALVFKLTVDRITLETEIPAVGQGETLVYQYGDNVRVAAVYDGDHPSEAVPLLRNPQLHLAALEHRSHSFRRLPSVRLSLFRGIYAVELHAAWTGAGGASQCAGPAPMLKRQMWFFILGGGICAVTFVVMAVLENRQRRKNSRACTPSPTC